MALAVCTMLLYSKIEKRKLNGEENYGALVEWACDISRYGDNAKLPDILVPHCFIPKEIQ